jgi:hypothetical protein
LTVHARALPPDDIHRRALSAEVHSRPSESLETPCQVTCVAVRIDDVQREAADRHFAALVASSASEPGTSRATIGDLRVIRESHSEFNSYTVVAAGMNPTPSGEPPSHACRQVGSLRYRDA